MNKHLAHSAMLAAAGLLSGLITIFSFRVLGGGGGNDYFNGGLFGAVLALFLWLFRGLRSPLNAALLVATSIVAYKLASLVAWPIRLRILGFPDSEYFTAGFVGAFLLFAAALFLAYPEKKGWRIFALAGAFGLGGGLLGLAGWSLGKPLGEPIDRVLASLNLSSSFGVGQDLMPSLYSLHPVWQAGMGLLMGGLFWLVDQNNAPAQGWMNSTPQKLRVSGRIFFSSMLFLLSIGLYGTLHDAFQTRSAVSHSESQPSR